MSHRVLRLLGLVLVLCLVNSVALAAIYQWTTDPSGNIIQSTTLCPDGANVSAGPNVSLSGLNLTKAYLISANLNEDYCDSIDLTNAALNNASAAYASFYNSNLTNAMLVNADLTGTGFYSSNLTNADLTNAHLSALGWVIPR